MKKTLLVLAAALLALSLSAPIASANCPHRLPVDRVHCAIGSKFFVGCGWRTDYHASSPCVFCSGISGSPPTFSLGVCHLDISATWPATTIPFFLTYMLC